MIRLVLGFLLCATAPVRAQHEWGFVLGGHASYFSLNKDKDDYWTRGSAEGGGGISLGVQFNGFDTVGCDWLSFELQYAERRTEVHSVFAYKVGTATTAYAIDYAILSVGYLPRFPLFGSRRWCLVSGVRLGLPLYVNGAGFEEVTGGLAGPPNYYRYTSFSDRASLEEIIGLDVRVVLALEHVLPIGDRSRFMLGTGIEHGLAPQNVYGGAGVTNSDIFLRVGYRIVRG